MVVAMSQKTQVRQRKFVPSDERGLPEGEQTVFYYRLPPRGVQHIIFGDIGRSFSLGLQQIDAMLMACLTRIENLRDDEGVVLEWVPDNRQVSAKILGALPYMIRFEVGGHIISEMRQGPEVKIDDDAKNDG